jgi:hypothetical protein
MLSHKLFVVLGNCCEPWLRCEVCKCLQFRPNRERINYPSQYALSCCHDFLILHEEFMQQLQMLRASTAIAQKNVPGKVLSLNDFVENWDKRIQRGMHGSQGSCRRCPTALSRLPCIADRIQRLSLSVRDRVAICGGRFKLSERVSN